MKCGAHDKEGVDCADSTIYDGGNGVGAKMAVECLKGSKISEKGALGAAAKCVEGKKCAGAKGEGAKGVYVNDEGKSYVQDTEGVNQKVSETFFFLSCLSHLENSVAAMIYRKCMCTMKGVDEKGVTAKGEVENGASAKDNIKRVAHDKEGLECVDSAIGDGVKGVGAKMDHKGGTAAKMD